MSQNTSICSYESSNESDECCIPPPLIQLNDQLLNSVTNETQINGSFLSSDATTTINNNNFNGNSNEKLKRRRVVADENSVISLTNHSIVLNETKYPNFSPSEEKNTLGQSNELCCSITDLSTQSNNGKTTTENSRDTNIVVANERRLLHLLPKEVFIEILIDAAQCHEDIAAEVDRVLENYPPCRRLMVRNVNFVTENSAFHQVFSRLGHVEDYTIVRDKETRRSKGFGFVTFKSLASVRAVLCRSIFLDGRELQIKLAAGDIVDSDTSGNYSNSGSVSNSHRSRNYVNNNHSNSHQSNSRHHSSNTNDQHHSQDKQRRKLFIRNLSDSITTERLRYAFREFGEMEDCVAVTDHFTGHSKGYGFVTFIRPEDAARAVQNSQRIIDGQMAFVSYASPENSDRNNRDCNKNNNENQAPRHLNHQNIHPINTNTLNNTTQPPPFYGCYINNPNTGACLYTPSSDVEQQFHPPPQITPSAIYYVPPINRMPQVTLPSINPISVVGRPSISQTNSNENRFNCIDNFNNSSTVVSTPRSSQHSSQISAPQYQHSVVQPSLYM